MPTQAPPDSDLGFPAKGSLKRVPFAFLVRDIARTRSTGNLYLLAGETKKVVFFVDGRPTLVRSNLPSEFLGQILTDQGLITQEQCDNTLEAIRRTGKKQGELLVEMGILSEGNLRYGLEEQVRIKLFEIFGWEEGRFQFKQSGEPGMPATGMSLEQAVEALILSGVQERWTDERARIALKALADRYPTVQPRWTTDASALDLLPEEAYFLRCLDGSRTIDELLARKYDPEVPQLSTLLFGLIASGVVEASETKQTRRLPPPRPNLNPQNPPDDTLAPKFEQLSAITEYEDTPLPNKLPGGAAISSSRNPRIPILPTEDEEMFRGLDVDESIVTDSRALLRGIERSRGAAPRSTADSVARAPEPKPLDEETDFGELGGDDDDDETDFSGLVHTTRPGGAPITQPPPPRPDPTKSVLPQPPLGRSDSGKSPLPQASPRPDTGNSAAPEPARPDSSKSPLPQPTPRSDTGKTTAPATAPTPTLGAPRPTLGVPTPGLRLPTAPQQAARPVPIQPAPVPVEPVIAADPIEPPVMDPLDHLEDPHLDDPDLGDPDLGDPDLGDLDDDIEVLDDETMLDDDTLGDDPLGDDPLGDDPLGDDPLGEEPLAAEPGPAMLGEDVGDDPVDDPVDDRADERQDDPPDDEGEMLGDSSLSEASDILPAIDLAEDPSGVIPLPDLDAAGEDEFGDDPLAGDDELIGDLDEDLELEDVELDEDLEADGDDFGADDQGFRSSNEDTDGGYRPQVGAESAELLGATRYGQAEDAMREGDYDQAVALFEDAYANGYDVPELHAHLAFCRFRASGNDPSSAPGALELLDWAEQADPGFPMIHAYRGAILVGLGRQEEADECFDRALYLDPENELAIAYTRGE